MPSRSAGGRSEEEAGIAPEIESRTPTIDASGTPVSSSRHSEVFVEARVENEERMSERFRSKICASFFKRRCVLLPSRSDQASSLKTAWLASVRMYPSRVTRRKSRRSEHSSQRIAPTVCARARAMPVWPHEHDQRGGGPEHQPPGGSEVLGAAAFDRVLLTMQRSTSRRRTRRSMDRCRAGGRE